MTAPLHLYGVLVTFRRPAELEQSLRSFREQTRPLDHLIVVDNGGGAEPVVRAYAPEAEYVSPSENLGPAGAIALGMQRVLERAADQDWMFTFDDDDWTSDRELFARLLGFASEMTARDPKTGCIGASGTRFDRSTGRIVRVPDEELRAAVPVDGIAGNQFPLYSVAALRAVGTFRSELFYGFEELEFGLRLRDAGYRIYVDGDLWLRGRERLGRLGLTPRPARSLRAEPSWERYYSIRNLVYILRGSGHRRAALRVAALTGVAKPLANLPRAPKLALRHLRVGLRAARDGWTGRLGRTIEPE